MTSVIEAVYLIADAPDPVCIYSFGHDHVAIFCTYAMINIAFLLTFSRASMTCDVVFILSKVGLTIIPRGIDLYLLFWLDTIHAFFASQVVAFTALICKLSSVH